MRSILRGCSDSENVIASGMKALVSTIGSRGDVQPLLALALELRALGHDAVVCVAPNFKEWVESLGFTCFPIRPDLKEHDGS